MKTLYYLKRALSLPPHIALQKIARKLKQGYTSRKNKWIDQQFPTYMSSCPYGKLHRFIRPLERFLLPADRIRQENAHFLKHEFDLLGSGCVRVEPGMQCRGIEGIRYSASKGAINEKNRSESERIRRLIRQPYLPIDWQLDFKSGYRWDEGTWSRDIQYGDQPGADVKVPWELSRMQHLPLLALGYALDQKSVYLGEFQNQILDFIASNPPRYGVNWSCTMDVGIRIANWLIAFDLFSAQGARFDPDFEKVLIRSVYEHGHHIRNHLEWDPYLRSNHYLANLAGLLFVAAYLDHESWFAFAVRELTQEVLSQFHPDGSNFEASTSYHRLSAEMVLYATALALEKRAVFPAEYGERIEKMADFIRDTAKPDGTALQFGDNDSGRFVKMTSRFCPLRKDLTLTALLETQFLAAQEQGTSHVYPDFGLYLYRREPWFLAVRCGSIGQKGNGGHAHNDQLSFELCVQGISLIVDPGTYVYTPIPEARRRFRSTAMHNTLVAGEQNQDKGLFQLSDRAKARGIQLQEDLFVGEHEGFGPVHRRILKIGPDCIEGTDLFEGPAEIHFHLAPGWKGVLLNENETAWSCGHLTVCISSSAVCRLGTSQYSRAYGEMEPGPLLNLLPVSKRTSWRIAISPSPTR